MHTLNISRATSVMTTIVVFCAVMSVNARYLEQAPGDVFREYYWTSGNYLAVSYYEQGSGILQFPGTIDLVDAQKVVAVVQWTNCHRCSGRQYIRVNGHAWRTIPWDSLKPDPCFSMQYDCATAPIPLSDFTTGSNTFELTADGPGDWLAHFFWGVTFRVYYDPAKKPHPTGRILTPAPNSAMGKQVQVTAEASSPNGAIKRVDYLGLYEDVNYRCNGIWRQWAYYLLHNEYSRHIGSATSGPSWAVSWDNEWVCDQKEPMQIMARIIDHTNMVHVTDAVTGLTFNRPGLFVELYHQENLDSSLYIGGYGTWHTGWGTFTIARDVSSIIGATFAITAWNTAASV